MENKTIQALAIGLFVSFGAVVKAEEVKKVDVDLSSYSSLLDALPGPKKEQEKRSLAQKISKGLSLEQQLAGFEQARAARHDELEKEYADDEDGRYARVNREFTWQEDLVRERLGEIRDFLKERQVTSAVLQQNPELFAQYQRWQEDEVRSIAEIKKCEKNEKCAKELMRARCFFHFHTDDILKNQ